MAINPRPLPSQELLLELLECTPETGLLFWKRRGVHHFSDGGRGAIAIMRMWNTRYAGKSAFTADTNHGYKHGNIFDTKYKAHRVIWKMVHDEEPLQIDHINHDPADNRIVNLRASSYGHNHKNMSMPKNNTSGFVGVYWYKPTEEWQAQIMINGKSVYLGRFTDKDAAIAARKAANIEYRFHQNHGKQQGAAQ